LPALAPRRVSTTELPLKIKNVGILNRINVSESVQVRGQTYAEIEYCATMSLF
jgi:hypothetical protein